MTPANRNLSGANGRWLHWNRCRHSGWYKGSGRQAMLQKKPPIWAAFSFGGGGGIVRGQLCRSPQRRPRPCRGVAVWIRPDWTDRDSKKESARLIPKELSYLPYQQPRHSAGFCLSK
jgi:hypothetical protein